MKIFRMVKMTSNQGENIIHEHIHTYGFYHSGATGTAGLITESERSSEKGESYPLQYSGLNWQMDSLPPEKIICVCVCVFMYNIPSANSGAAGTVGLIAESERSPGKGNGKPLE